MLNMITQYKETGSTKISLEIKLTFKLWGKTV